MRSTSTLTSVAAAAAVLLAGCGSATRGSADGGGLPAGSPTAGVRTTAVDPPTPAGTPSATPDSSAPATSAAPGAYLTLAEYEGRKSEREGTKVVYFFHASWCPTCRAAEKAILRDGIPAGLTVVKVDYDGDTDLRRRYGVTTQHTFVQVDRAGAPLTKWTGSRGGSEILAETV